MVALQQNSAHFAERALRNVLLLCLLVYVFSAKGNIEIDDTRYSLSTAQQIVAHGRLDIPNSEGYTFRAPDGRSYSKFGIGLALYYVPWVAAGDTLSRFARLPPLELNGFLVSFANIPFAILTLVLFAELLKWFGFTGTYTWLFPLTLGLGTMTWRYAVYDFSEAMQMGLLMLAVCAVVRGASKSIVCGGAAFAWLFLVKLLNVAYLPLFLAYLLTRPGDLRRRTRSAALFISPFVLASCFLLWLNVVRFGNAWESGYGAEARLFFPLQLWQSVPQLLGSLDTGLFVYCPVLLLGILGSKEFASRYRAEALLCGGLVAGNLILTGAWWAWHGWWVWGPRFLVPMIPFWLLPAAFWLARLPSQAKYWTFAGFTLISVALQIPGVLVKDNEINFIKQSMLTKQEQRFAPSNYVADCIVFWHKLGGRNEVYPVSDFHIPGDRQLDLTGHSTFIGFNVWTEQVARRMSRPALRWLPLAALFLLGYLAIRVGATIRDRLHATTSV